MEQKKTCSSAAAEVIYIILQRNLERAVPIITGKLFNRNQLVYPHLQLCKQASPLLEKGAHEGGVTRKALAERVRFMYVLSFL